MPSARRIRQRELESQKDSTKFYSMPLEPCSNKDKFHADFGDSPFYTPPTSEIEQSSLELIQRVINFS